MKVELIPVVEVDIRQPETVKLLASATPFAPNLPFYRPSNMTPSTVGAVAEKHLKAYFDGKWPLEEQCSFFGGYVLRINGQNVLFQQCCGELSDIVYWKHLAKYGRSAYCNGHPAPKVTFTTTEVIFDCRNEYEEFRPFTSPEIRIAKSTLSAAYNQALLELEVFARLLEQAQQELTLPVEDIAHVLIYRNAELPDE